MNIPVWIEPVPGNGYRAMGGDAATLVGEGATPDQALEALRQSLQQRIETGARLVTLEIPAADHPWLPFAGMYREDDPLVQEWLEIMKSKREEDEAAE